LTIEPIRGRGVNRATAQCDGCGREETVTCDYERGGRGCDWTPNEGQINRKLVGMGWAFVKGKHSCPLCEAKRKAEASAQKETIVPEPKTNVAPIRQPTPEQEVDIIVVLSTAYDRKAKRYHGKETDKTVAETIGGGVMPGWVAAIREAKFGPAGNEEVESIRREIAAIRDGMNKRLTEMERRLDACIGNHDKRVG